MKFRKMVKLCELSAESCDEELGPIEEKISAKILQYKDLVKTPWVFLACALDPSFRSDTITD